MSFKEETMPLHTMRRLLTAIVPITLLGLLLSACGGTMPTSEPTDTSPATPEIQPVALEVAQSTLPRDTVPEVSETDLSELTAGNNAFAFDLYRVLASSEEDNLILSPYSISLALAMAYGGAREETRSQMADTLHFTLPDERLYAAFNALDLHLSNLNNQGTPEEGEQPFRLNVANAVWGQRDYPFETDYLDLLAQNFGAGLRLTDFIRDPEASRQTINDWVAEQTEQRIRDLLAPGTISPDTRLVLTNAIYFFGAWASQFEEENTADALFTLLDGSTVTVPMMNQTDYFLHVLGDGYTAIQLPYEGRQASMLIVMPNQGNFADFESTFDAAKLDEIRGQLIGGEVILSMPRWEHEASFELPEALSQLGMQDAFIGGVANFTGIANPPNEPPLFISNVIHKAFIKVDEQGTEAAAATAVIMEAASAPAEEPVEIRLDHPFMYFILDQQTGTILFMGRVLNPAG
jgi:serpin B